MEQLDEERGLVSELRLVDLGVDCGDPSFERVFGNGIVFFVDGGCRSNEFIDEGGVRG